MAIPISEYIDIKSNVLNSVVGSRDFSGLVFTKDAMLSSVGYDTVKTDYEINHKSVLLTLDGVNKYFGATSKVAQFAADYFSYNGGNKKPSYINVAKVMLSTRAASASESHSMSASGATLTFTQSTFITKAGTSYGLYEFVYDSDESSWTLNGSAITASQYGIATTGTLTDGDTCTVAYVSPESAETAKAAYSRITEQTVNFGAFTFLDEGATSATRDYSLTATGGLKDVATANEGSEANNIMIVRLFENEATDTVSGYFNGNAYTHCCVTSDIYGAWMALAWYASVDYDLAGSAGTIDYKQFSGEAAVVTSLSAKKSYDGNRFNYVGKVQVYGTGLSFYQKGLNMDGVDLGARRDESWIKGEVVTGWFNLVSSVQKVPASSIGLGMVEAMLVDVASRGIENGTILCDKPLTANQISEIYAYTNDDAAADTVQAQGYYIDAELVLDDDGTTYKCVYTLVYAKGDHIGKVVGDHILA